MSSPGFGPGPRPSQSRVRSTTLRGRFASFREGKLPLSLFQFLKPARQEPALPDQRHYPAEDSNLVWQLRTLPCVHHTRRASFNNISDLDSNQDQDLRRLRCDPLHHRDKSHSINKRADGWIRTSIILFTKQVPFSVEPRRQSNDAREHEREESNPVGRFWRPPALPGARSCKPTDSCPWAFSFGRAKLLLSLFRFCSIQKRLGGSLALPGKINSPAGRSSTPR